MNKQNGELLKSLHDGNVAAMEILYNEHRVWMESLAAELLEKNTEDNAKLLVREYMVEFWEKRKFREIRHAGEITSYLHGDVYRLCVNRTRKKKRDRKVNWNPLKRILTYIYNRDGVSKG